MLRLPLHRGTDGTPSTATEWHLLVEASVSRPRPGMTCCLQRTFDSADRRSLAYSLGHSHAVCWASQPVATPASLMMCCMWPLPLRKTDSGLTKDGSRAGGATIPAPTVTLQ